MISRRTVLKSLVLTTGAAALGATPGLAQSAPAPTPGGEGEVFKLPPLGYDYDALEPYLSAATMKLHHDKHHAAYVSRLNQAVATLPPGERLSIEELLGQLDRLPPEIRETVRDHGGGHANHSLFWRLLKKNEGGRPVGELAKELTQAFGSTDDFQQKFLSAAQGIFGSGWAWLVWRNRRLVVETTANQDSPYLSGGVPLLGLDVWEHAYYLDYQNRRAEYLAAFAHLIDWEWANERFNQISAA